MPRTYGSCECSHAIGVVLRGKVAIGGIGMKTPKVVPCLGPARGVGVFSWPLTPGGASMTSPQCRKILAAGVTDCRSFRRLLNPVSASAFHAALEKGDPFALELELTNKRLVSMTADFDGATAGRRLSGMLEDISKRRADITDLIAREEFCRALAENSPAMLWMGDQFGKCVFLNQAQRDFWGVDPQDLSTFDWGSTLHPEDIDKLAKPFRKAMEEHMPFSVEARYRRADGQLRSLRSEARPRFDDAGTFLGMTGVNSDITDQLIAEEHTRILMGELNHRTKNVLTVVQAVARQTSRLSAPEDFQRIFSERLKGMAASNDLLVKNDWRGVTMSELVGAQLTHIEDFVGSRIHLEGPELQFSSDAAQVLGMAFHELATNSIKYGALRTEKGRIDLSWTKEPGTAGFTLSWIESGIGPADGPKTRPVVEGFGHKVIVDMISSALDATVDIRFDPDGFKWIVTARSDSAIIA